MSWNFPVADYKRLPRERREAADLISKETVGQGAFLIKNVPDLKSAHALIQERAIYSSAPPTWAHLKDMPATVEVSNIVHPKTGKMGWFQDKAIVWHTNGACMEEPENCVALFCGIPPRSGGETEIINMRAAYNGLSDEERERLQDVRIRCDIRHYKFKNDEIKDFQKHSQKYKGFQPFSEKPLFCRHPLDGKYGLWFPFGIVDRVAGLEKGESEALIARLRSFVLQAKYHSALKWEKHDLLFMDQIHTLHRRGEFEGRRRLYRICFSWKG